MPGHAVVVAVAVEVGVPVYEHSVAWHLNPVGQHP
jgi:hypothetical protein